MLTVFELIKLFKVFIKNAEVKQRNDNKYKSF
jgi:hypothetical protein